MSGMLERIKDRWTAEGIAIRPGVSPEALAAFEAKYAVALPPAVRSYFGAVDGSGEDSDREHFRFWPIEEVVPLSEYCLCESGSEPWADRWFVFVDHLINSFHLAVELTPDPANAGPVALANGLELHPRAPSFEIFLDLYLADEKNLYKAWRSPGGAIARGDGPTSTW